MMGDVDALISVVAPIRDDGHNLAAFVAETVETLAAHYADFELVLVDDGSTDASVEIVDRLLETYPCLRMIRLSRRHGTDVAVSAGLDLSIGDYVVVMRPLYDPPAEIPAMVLAAASGPGVVLGTCARRDEYGPLVRAGRRAFFWVARRLLPDTPPTDATGFCVLSRRVSNAVIRTRSKHRHLGFLSCAVGSGIRLHPYRMVARPHRRPDRSLREAIDEAISVLVTNSSVPLRLVSYFGAASGALNLLYVAYSRRLLTDPRVAPFRDAFSAYELHYYLAIRAARLGYDVRELPVTRAYPARGKTPTKISKVRGNLLILRTLARACLGHFDPPETGAAHGAEEPGDDHRPDRPHGLRRRQPRPPAALR